MRSFPTAFLATLALVGCAHAPSASADVFRTPSRFVGQTVQVCGYIIDSSNIVETSNRDDAQHKGGLSIDDKGPLDPQHRGRLCVEGDVTYLGCASGHLICTDWAYDYGIRIRRIIS